MYKLIYLSVIIYCTKFFYVYIMLYDYWSTATLIKYINYKSDYLFSTNTNVKPESDWQSYNNILSHVFVLQ